MRLCHKSAMGKADKLESTSNLPAKGRIRGVSKNSAEARRKILDSATLIFGKQGFARTKTEEIAEHAGYGQATVFFHFKTKAGLLEACLDWDPSNRIKAVHALQHEFLK